MLWRLGSRGRLPGSLCGVRPTDPCHPANRRRPRLPHWTGIIYITLVVVDTFAAIKVLYFFCV